MLPSSSTVSFSHKVAEKLDEDNFLLWRQQIEPVLRFHNLYEFIASPAIPQQFLSDQDRDANHMNPAYFTWSQQDQQLMSWLQSTLSSAILSRVLGSSHAFEVWEKIHAYFHHTTRAKARQLRSELRSTALDNHTVKEFLHRIKTLVNSLSSVGDPISPQEHLDVILEGLSQEYDPVISLIESKTETMTIEEAEGLILAQELRIQKYRKRTLTDSASINLTHSLGPQSHNSSAVPSQGSASQSQPLIQASSGQHSETYQAFGRGRGGRSGRGRGRGGGRFSVQCQVCFKFGHTAAVCYHRFNQNYQATIPSNSPSYSLNSQFHHNNGNGFPASSFPQHPPFLPPRPHPPQFPTPQPYYPQQQQQQQQYRSQAMLLSSDPTGSQSWYPDSGATFHVTGNQQHIQQTAPFEGPDQIFIGNGQGHS